MFLPMLTLPFLCLAFWALGGGRGEAPDEALANRGINLTLPEVMPEQMELDKMQSYELAEEGRLAKEPVGWELDWGFTGNQEPDAGLDVDFRSGFGLEETELALMEKLEEIRFLAQEPEEPRVSGIGTPLPESAGSEPMPSDAELSRLELMMASLVENEDPEMERIDAMLDKLLDLQYPERVVKSPDSGVTGQTPFAVALEPVLQQPVIDPGLGEMATERSVESNRFYSLENSSPMTLSGIRPAIEARVAGDQEIVSGASIELELVQAVYVQGVEFAEGTPVSGKCNLVGERLEIRVEAIRSGNLVLPVRLSVVGEDGLSGIRIPGMRARDALNRGMADGVQTLDILPLSSSWESRAAMAGMGTVKSLVSKRAREYRVTVKAGHPLLLMDLSGD